MGAWKKLKEFITKSLFGNYAVEPKFNKVQQILLSGMLLLQNLVYENQDIEESSYKPGKLFN